MARKKTIDFIEEDGKYFFIYDKSSIGIFVKYEVNSTSLQVNDRTISLEKPFDNIVEFEKFCIETDLF